VYPKDVRCGLDSSGWGQGPVMGVCQHSNGRFGSVNSGEYRDYFVVCYLLRKNLMELVVFTPLRLATAPHDTA
jgi:hypothetical protein